MRSKLVVFSTVSLALSSLSLIAGASPAKHAKSAAAHGNHWEPVCPDHSCKSHRLVDADGHLVVTAAPAGIGAPDIQKAYSIDPTLGSGATVAVVDAFGYTDLESDLAMYRSTFGLPPCTVASGCLTIVNDNGETTPLPAQPAGSADQGWNEESALDVDMVSAACPQCKIVAVQAGAPGTAGLSVAQSAAVKLQVTTISNSWGQPEDGDTLSEDQDFNNPGIGNFAAAGDNGYDSFQQGLSGPSYPSTSTFVIGVGGTTMTADSTQARGWSEVAWTDGGSSCSVTIPKPSYQPSQAACPMRAASDISAVGDGGSQGIAIYVAADHGWSEVDGTSAATPVAAGIFAGAGHGDALPGFVYKHPEAFLDITMGTNGSCESNLCNAGEGWDGPTGVGTPNQAMLKAIGGVVGNGPAVSFTYPADGDTVSAGFTIQVMPDATATYTEIDIDGTKVGAVNADPFQLTAPMSLADGAHVLTATAFDLDHNSKSTMINITLGGSGSGDDDSGGGGGGGCAAGAGAAGNGVLLALGALIAARRRRTAVA